MVSVIGAYAQTGGVYGNGLTTISVALTSPTNAGSEQQGGTPVNGTECVTAFTRLMEKASISSILSSLEPQKFIQGETTMTDILERLKAAVDDENKSGSALLNEAVAEIERLREEYNKMRRQIEEYQKLSEPEF